MRDVELRAMLEQIAAPLPLAEPTDEQLHDLFWSEASLRELDARKGKATSPLEQCPNNVLTAAERAAAETLQLRVKLEYEQRREAAMLQLVTGPPVPAPPQAPVTPAAPPDFWARTCYRVQLLSGGEWYDCLNSTSSTRAGAETYRDRLKRAQPHLLLRILEPTA
jgi:molybdenum cofactor biosynthesis enzyme MoaA